MAYFPMFVDLKGREILVAGGGAVAERRIATLMGFGCRITVVSPALTEGLKMVYGDGEISWRKKMYESSDLKPVSGAPEFTFVLAATDDEAVNERIVLDCHRAGLPVNNASKKELCDFYFPGIIRENGLVVGVSTGGSDYRKAAEATKLLRAFIRETWRA